MRFWLEIQRVGGITEERAVQPRGSDAVGVADGECPGCRVTPFLVRGCGVESVDADTVRSGGRCLSCNDNVGWVYGRADTIFGAEEDRVMLDPETRGSRARIYR